MFHTYQQKNSEGDSSGSVAQDIFASCIFVFLIMIMYLFTNRGPDQVSKKVATRQNYSSILVLGVKSKAKLPDQLEYQNSDLIVETFRSRDENEASIIIDTSLAGDDQFQFRLNVNHSVFELSLEGALGRYVVDEAWIKNCVTRNFLVSKKNKRLKCISL